MNTVLLYDIKNSFKKNKIKYLLFLIFMCTLYAVFVIDCRNSLSDGFISGKPTFADFLIYDLRGMFIYIPEAGEPFEIPVKWLVIQVMITFSIAKYTDDEMSGTGIQLLLRTKNVGSWFLGKIIYGIVVSVTFYLIIFAVAFVGSIIGLTTLSLTPSTDICAYINEIDEISSGLLTEAKLVEYVIVLPVLTSAVITVLQTVLSLFFKPIISFIATICYQVCSAYFSYFFLIGNYSMLMRSEVCIYNGFTFVEALIVEAIMALVLLVIGRIKLMKQDYLHKE